MVVCKFFLQGTCKFGEMCKFEHELNENFNSYQSSGPSTTWRNPTVFGATPLAQPKMNPLLGHEQKNVDINTLVKSVVSDMTQAEKGGQWLFSCYAPFKEKPAFPGFEDQSFEEIRLGYYDAVARGSIDQFKQQVQGMVQDVLVKVRSLQNPSPDIVNMLVNIYNTPASPQAGVYAGNTFSNNVNSNFTFKSGPVSQQPIFAQANQNVFANSQQTLFGGKSVFGASNQMTQNNSLFSANTQNTSNNLFASPANTNVFQSPPSQGQTSTNIFSSQANTNTGVQNNSILNSQQPPAGSMFSTNQQNQSNSPFQQASQASNIFASSNVQQQTLVNSNANIFNGVQNPQPQQNAMFGQLSNSIFATNNEATQPQAYTSNIFNNAQNNAAHFGGPPAQFDQSIYSKLEDLTEEEIKWFESDDLDITKMPEKPPTYEMCFRR